MMEKYTIHFLYDHKVAAFGFIPSFNRASVFSVGSGLLVSHDTMEHNPNINRYNVFADEILALGAVVAHRIKGRGLDLQQQVSHTIAEVVNSLQRSVIGDPSLKNDFLLPASELNSLKPSIATQDIITAALDDINLQVMSQGFVWDTHSILGVTPGQLRQNLESLLTKGQMDFQRRYAHVPQDVFCGLYDKVGDKLDNLLVLSQFSDFIQNPKNETTSNSLDVSLIIDYTGNDVVVNLLH